MNESARTRTVWSCSLLVAALTAATAACSSGNQLTAEPYDAASQVALGGLTDGGTADPDKPLEVTSRGDGGRITDVTAHDESGRYVAGKLSADGRHWRSTAALAAGAHYTVRVSTENEDGRPGRKVLSFDTGHPQRATQQLTVTFGPKAGEYGVGQPITAKLSAPIHDRADRITVERALGVQSEPAVEGSWYWVDAKTLHYRPREYWPAHATIRVRSGLKGVRINDTLWGGDAKPLKLTTGDRIEAVTNASDHTLTVYRNGKDIRDIPVTTGKPGFETRNGIKVVLEKQSFVQMRSSTVGIAEGSGDSYDIPVHWATRVTWSGEYVHAAPWSEGSQGSANVSHGCTGMSTENAEWFYNTVREGDLVRVVGSDGENMTPFDNGFGDWNLGWAKWREGSALLGGGNADPGQEKISAAARLRPEV
jgi:lipoprotein-anchoring transpeptidase ErfK/SrfK